MKSKLLYLHYITLFIFCQALVALAPGSLAFATDYQATNTYERAVESEYLERYLSHGLDYVSYDTSDFYFSDFTVDYYLEKDEDNISHLRVKESVTAEFPPYKQNKGLTRKIPYTNQNGKNLTLDSLNTSNIKVTRNGLPEPIYSIEEDRSQKSFIVATGTEEYLTGSQIYTFEYTFDRVITDFPKLNLQELYWDTNGTDSYQPFQKITATVHFDDSVYGAIIQDKTSCYVGSYKASGQERCNIQSDHNSKSITFSTQNLKSFENLTFVIDFQSDTFVVPSKPISIINTVTLGGYILIISIMFVTIFITIKSRKDSLAANRNIFVKPEYQPLKNFTVSEAAKVSIAASDGPSAMVATITDLAIQGKVVLRRGEKNVLGKYAWSIEIKDVTDLLPHEINILQMLIGKKLGSEKLSHQTFDIANHQENYSIYKTFSDNLEERMQSSKLLYKKPFSIAIQIAVLLLISMFGPFFIVLLPEYSLPDPILIATFIVASSLIGALIMVLIQVAIKPACDRTVEGIKVSKYYDGLKLYIKMAEVERIEFLQSVEGADTSNQGIVKLYEKLLPYAIIFGLEKSWLKQLEHYYTEASVSPTWYVGDGLILSDFGRDFASFNAASSSSFASSMPSTGGSGSSGSSGGGGGGFSGGGGGGGGFGGR